MKKDDEAQVEGDEDNDDEESSSSSSVSLSQGYDYLLSMKIWSLTMEKVKALTFERDEKRKELDILAAKTPEDLWLEDLDALEVALDSFEGELVAAEKQEAAARKKAQVTNTDYIVINGCRIMNSAEPVHFYIVFSCISCKLLNGQESVLRIYRLSVPFLHYTLYYLECILFFTFTDSNNTYFDFF